MTSIATLRAGLAANLATIPGLRVAETIPDNPNPPIAVVLPPSIQFDTSFGRGADTYTFVIALIVARSDERSSQIRMDGYCDPTGSSSIKTAIESDKNLGGAAMSLRVQEMRNYQSLAVGEVTYLSAEWVVQVIA